MDTLRQRIQAHMETICLKFGSRHCGAPGEKQTGDYIEQYFRELGLDVITEQFPARGWRFEDFELYNVSQGCPVPGATACYFSGAVDIEDTPLILTESHIQNLEQQPVKNRLCFVTALGMALHYNVIAEKLEALGAAGAVFVSKATDLAPNTKTVRSPMISRMGTAAVSMAGAYHMMKHVGDTYRMRIRAESYDTHTRNIIARIGSGQRKGVIGAHYDAAPLIQGANDNASGTAMLLELARLLQKEKLPLTLDFVAFSAEEYMMGDYPVGSKAYLDRHTQEDICWYFNCDSCCDYFGTTTLGIGLGEALPKLVSKYPAEKRTGGGDNKTFCENGIPSVWLRTDQGFDLLHTAQDTLDKLDYSLIADKCSNMYDLIRQLIQA